MAGRSANDKLDANFQSYSKSSEPQNRDPTKAVGDEVTTLKHPVAQDLASSGGPARSAPVKKSKKKKKKAREKSNVCCQLLSWV